MHSRPEATAVLVGSLRPEFCLFARAALILALLGLATPAWSYDEEQHAEYLRLRERMTTLAQKNQWTGVERTYLEMVDKKLEMTHEDHLLAADAARTMGDVGAQQRRYERALASWPNIEITQKLAEIQRKYGQVILMGKAGSTELVPDQRPFQPDLAAAIDFAADKVQAEGRYEGVLPFGGYKLNTEPFVVELLQPPLTVKAKGAVELPPPDITGPEGPAEPGGQGISGAKIGLLGGAGAALIGAGVLQLMANGAKKDFQNSGPGDAEIEAAAAKANTLQYAAIGTGVAGIGLGVGAVFVVDF